MKRILLNLSIAMFFIAAVGIHASAQGVPPYKNEKFGADSASRVKCAMNMSLYSEFYKQRNYKDALKPWREVYRHAPKASKNTFIKGANIYKNLIAKEKDDKVKSALIDTLMMIYDKRIEIFGQRGSVLSYKSVDLFSLKKDSYAEVYPIAKEAMELSKEKTQSAVVTTFMQSAVELYKTKKIDGDEVIEAYSFSMDILSLASEYCEKRIAKNDKYSKRYKDEAENVKTSVSNVEALFSESGAATCEALINIFSAKYEESKENIEWLKKVTKLLDKSDCTGSKLYADASEKLYALEPSAESAHNLARLFLKTQDYTKAEGYYDEATKLQEDEKTKALYYYEWSTLAMACKSFAKVKNLSLNALKLNPNDGRPYIMIGKAYAADAKNIGNESVEHSAVYWAAVDKFYRAKAVDSSLEAQANELINTYSRYFPNKEEAFMFGIEAGGSYHVGGWINENTKARF